MKNLKWQFYPSFSFDYDTYIDNSWLEQDYVLPYIFKFHYLCVGPLQLRWMSIYKNI